MYPYIPHVCVQLRLNSSSRALLKSCCVSCNKNNASQICSSGPEVFFGKGFSFYLLLEKNDIAWESTSLMWDVARCQTQTDTKPIGICSEILSCLCTYTLPHMYVQLRLNFSSKVLPKSCCVPCSKFKFLSFAVRDQNCSSGWVGPLPFICKTDTAWESTSLIKDVAIR